MSGRCDCGVGILIFRRILRRDATKYTKLEKPSGHTVVTHPGILLTEIPKSRKTDKAESAGEEEDMVDEASVMVSEEMYHDGRTTSRRDSLQRIGITTTWVGQMLIQW